MWECPDFLDLPARTRKPRRTGLTHVLDKGASPAAVEGLLSTAGDLVDIAKIGWGIAYVDRAVKQRIAAYHEAGVVVCLGGTLLEIAVAQGRVRELARWAAALGIDAVEVSNGLCRLSPERKQDLVRKLSTSFVVLAETGAKDPRVPVAGLEWAAGMAGDLTAGARWVIAEGRESGTVGLYEPGGSVRAWLVDSITARVGHERVIFEAPRRAQQTWLIRRFGPDVNLGNIALDDVLTLETLRLGLRADTARAAGEGWASARPAGGDRE
ncbi:MAG: phosphosulfolactate synthase [Egibacteraceae bacterium]